MQCDKCGSDSSSFVIHDAERQVWCRACHDTAKFIPNDAHGVVGDECDIWIKHGLCHSDGSPKHYTSRKEIAEEAKRRGMVNMVRTATTPGPNSHRKVFGMRGHTKGSTQT